MKPPANWFESLPRNRLLAEISLWSADLGRLEADMLRVEAGADIYHIDVTDGHFAPSLLFFPDLVARLRRATARPFHVHLMVTDDVLLEQIQQFAEAGADLISIHVESLSVEVGLAAIRDAGAKAGLVVRLETAVTDVAPWLDRIDMLTLLGTRLGVKGQGLDDEAPARLTRARTLIAGRPIVLAADGGIRDTTVPRLRAAGAQTVVMGSLAFGAPDFAARIDWLRGLPAP